MEEQIETRTNLGYLLVSFIVGALAGGLAGSVTMLLYAPQSGKRTRAKIQQKSIELTERMNNTVEDAVAQTRSKAHQIKVDLKHQGKMIQDRGQAVVDDQKERLSTLVEAGKTAVQGALN